MISGRWRKRDLTWMAVCGLQVASLTTHSKYGPISSESSKKTLLAQHRNGRNEPTKQANGPHAHMASAALPQFDNVDLCGVLRGLESVHFADFVPLDNQHRLGFDVARRPFVADCF